MEEIKLDSLRGFNSRSFYESTTDIMLNTSGIVIPKHIGESLGAIADNKNNLLVVVYRPESEKPTILIGCYQLMADIPPQLREFAKKMPYYPNTKRFAVHCKPIRDLLKHTGRLEKIDEVKIADKTYFEYAVKSAEYPGN